VQQYEVRAVSRSEAQTYAAAVLKQVYDCGVQKLRYIGGGSFGYVFAAEIDVSPFTVILKGCRTAGICAREADELSLLGADSLVPVPRVYFTFFATQEIPLDFIGMEKMNGTNCFTDWRKLLLPKRTKARFADEVTTFIRHWHARTNDRFGLIGNAVYDDWLDYYRPFAADVLESARRLAADGKLEPRVVRVMEQGWDAFDQIFCEKVETPRLIHGDMNVMNILSDKKLQNLAVIDPLESKWADAEYELFQLRNLTGDRFGLYETYKKKYPVSKMVDQKTAFYGLYHEVYAYILSGNKVNFILRPLVKRMEGELKRLEK
jgi:fructosamine-3-kinase